MSKAVLMSIHPKYVAMILNGKKTIEVRKTAPKLETPFKVYVYCTKGKPLVDGDRFDGVGFTTEYACLRRYSQKRAEAIFGEVFNGKVVAEFTCAKIHKVDNYGSQFSLNKDMALTNMIGARSRLDFDDMKRYLGTKDGYAWEIENLKIYDRPKELSEYYKIGAKGIREIEDLCDYCPCEKKHTTSPVSFGMRMSSYSSCDGLYCGEAYRRYKEENYAITRPPQSWCYVEEID